MNICVPKFLFIVFALALLGMPLSAQQPKIDLAVRKLEKKYLKKDKFNKAIKKGYKLQRINPENINNLGLQLFICKATYLGGQLNQCEKATNKLIDLSSDLDSLTSQERLALGEYFSLVGLYYNALAILPIDSNVKNLINIHHAKIKSGEFVSALDFENQINEKIPVFLATKAKNKVEYLNKLSLIGGYRLFVAERLEKTVSVDSALSYLLQYKKEWRLNAKKSTINARASWYISTLLQQRNEYKSAENYGETALKLQLKKHQVHHPTSLVYLANNLHVYSVQGKDRKVRDEIKAHYSKLNYYHKNKSSFNTVPLLLVEMERRALDGDYRGSDKLATSLLGLVSAYDSVPFAPVLKANESLYSYFIGRDNFESATTCIQTLGFITAKSVGKTAGVYALQQLETAQHQINFNYNPQALKTLEEGAFWSKYLVEYGVRNPHYFGLINAKANGYQINSQYKEQVQTLTTSVSLADSLHGKGELWANQLILLADAELSLGQFSAIQQYIDQAKPILYRELGSRSFSYLTCSRIEAELFENSGRLKEAEDIYKKTFRGLNKLSRRAGVSSYSQPEKMAQVLLLTGDYSAAEKILAQAVQQKTALAGGKGTSTVVPTFVLLAKLNYLKGDYVNAQRNAQEAIRIGSLFGVTNSLPILQANTLLADIDYSLGDYEYAEQKLKKTLKSQQASTGDSSAIVANTLLKLSLANYFTTGEVPLNQERVSKAANILSKDLGPNSIQVANALVYKGMFEMADKQLDSAMNTFQSAKVIYTDQLGSKTRENARVYGLMADVFLLKDSLNSAVKTQQSCVDIYAKILGDKHPDYIHAKGKLARIMADKKEYEAAFQLIKPVVDYYREFVQEVFPFLTSREKSKYWSQLKNDYDLYYGLVSRIKSSNQKELANLLEHRIQTKALQLRSSVAFQKDVRKMNTPEITALFEDWLKQKQTIASNYGLSVAELKDKGIDLNALEGKSNQLEKQLREKLYNNKSTAKSTTTKSVLKSIKDNEVLVEVIRHPSISQPGEINYSFVLCGIDNNKLTLVSAGGGQHLESGYYRYYRNAVKLNATDKYSYTHYWEVIDSLIPNGKKVMFSPDGIYGLMNPETFMDDEGKYIFEKNQFSLLNNPGDVTRVRTDSIRLIASRVEMIGNPRFYPNELDTKPVVKSLPGTAIEVDSLSSLLTLNGFEVATYTDDIATEFNIKTEVSPKILHIATHGYFEDENDVFAANNAFGEEVSRKNPLLLSGLVLTDGGLLFEGDVNKYSTDGLLTALEAKDLDLSTTDLVVLSACETGLGKVSDGEGVFGLQRAFLDAGSNSVVMSLFKVNDQVTSEFMHSFYSHWLNGSSKQVAMLEAKKEIKSKYNDPGYWGAFILVSN